jgi:hypothetical protein
MSRKKALRSRRSTLHLNAHMNTHFHNDPLRMDKVAGLGTRDGLARRRVCRDPEFKITLDVRSHSGQRNRVGNGNCSDIHGYVHMYAVGWFS